MSGKAVLVFVLAQVACNGWWFCFTQNVDLEKTPALAPPVLASAGLLFLFGKWILDEWDA